MGKFERKARRQAAADEPGKQVLQVRVEYPADGGGHPLFHTTLDCKGGELMQGMAVVAAEFVKLVKASRPEADLGLELAAFMGQVQMGAVDILLEGTD